MGPGMGGEEEREVSHVCIEKIKNGFVAKGMGMDSENAEFFKNLASSPTIISKVMGLKNKSARDIAENTRIKED